MGCRPEFVDRRVQSQGFRVSGSGFRIYRVKGSRVSGLGFRVYRVKGSRV